MKHTKHTPSLRFFRFTIAASVFASSLASAANLYVATTGSDSNAGTVSSAPLRTIVKASQLAKPGDIVNVAAGTYTGGFQTTSSGTATARITYQSTTKWGARIVPATNGVLLWDHRGNYSDIVGFDFDGSGSTTTRNGLYIGGSYNAVRGNHVHNVAQSVPCTSAGGSAIGSDSYYNGVNNDVIGNYVHHIGVSTCNFIQGIYISTSGNVKNNLAYNVGGAAIHLWHDASHVNIINNTTTSSGVGIVVGGGDFYHSTTLKADYVNVYNNIVFDNGIGITEQGTTGPNNSYLNNLVYQNSTNWDLDYGKSNAGTVAADPQFVSYNRTGSSVDFHLKSTSPAINRGLANLAPSTDIEGTARPQNSYFDIGAYEYRSTTAAVMNVSPTSLVFASQAVGTTSALQIVTVKNVGNANMTIPAGFVMSGDFDFGGTGTCKVGVSYAPGSSCTASVVFKPTAIGTRTGSLKITSNVSSVTVSLSGTGK
jgi:hypothetical protein